MDRKRKYCQGARNCYFEDDTTYKTNITILSTMNEIEKSKIDIKKIFLRSNGSFAY